MVEDLILLLAYMSATCLILGVAGFVADYILPHIGPLERWLETLPQWEDEDDDERRPER